MSDLTLEKVETAIDRLESVIASLTNLTTLPASIHVSAMRELLPEIAKDFRAALASHTGESRP